MLAHSVQPHLWSQGTNKQRDRLQIGLEEGLDETDLFEVCVKLVSECERDLEMNLNHVTFLKQVPDNYVFNEKPSK